MIKFFKFLVPGLAASLIGLLSLPAQAIVVAPPPLSTLFFSGNCEDCAAALQRPNFAVTARLVLQNYFQGSAITLANFVSFSYDGSNLLQPYSILSSSLPAVSGHISFALPSANEFHVTGANNYFDLFSLVAGTLECRQGQAQTMVALAPSALTLCPSPQRCC